MKKKKHRADLFLIGGVLAAGLILGLILLFSTRSGRVVKVRVSGQVVRTFSLDETVRYEIDGAGGGKNVLVIEGGKARMEAADCPDGLCMKMGKIHLSGQSVVCLPHKVVVEITEAANNDGEEIDIMVQ